MGAQVQHSEETERRVEAEAGLSRRLCRTVAGWRFEDLPEEVVRTVKLFLVDTFGVIAGAANAPGIAELNRRLAVWEPAGSATGLIGKRRYSPPSAALANGAAAHALDFDDIHDPARVHAYCVALPTMLAAAEDLGGISGRDFILALAISVELHARLGLVCNNSLGKGWHPTTIFGTPAAALGAGRLLKLDAERLLDALGIAHHLTAGSAQSMIDGALSKRLGAGFAARSALTAAFLAGDGLTGPFQPLEGSAGLFNLHERGEVQPDILMADLGERWHLLDYSLKPYPCCRCIHTTIGLALRLRGMGVRPEDVEDATIHLGQVNWQTVGQPYDASRDSIVHAQFNACYSFARTLVDGRIDLRTYQRPQITDPTVAALTARIRCLADPAVPATAMEPARIALLLKDGRAIEVSGNAIKGSPEEPMSEAETIEKFRGCLAVGLGAEASEADRFADMLLRIEAISDMRILAQAFPTLRS